MCKGHALSAFTGKTDLYTSFSYYCNIILVLTQESLLCCRKLQKDPNTG